uniref:G_PROTEIN_RECEP_F1_2 domain-containing protein n=1 Tax=Steinernema glaseri TaxID=37863 RepID=A0A1I8AAL7_9BILA
MIVTLTVTVVAYFFSAVCCAILIFVMRLMQVSKDVIAEAVTYAVIPGLLSYSVNYYVYFWRSAEYRYAFKRQLFCCYTWDRTDSNTAALVIRVPQHENTECPATKV